MSDTTPNDRNTDPGSAAVPGRHDSDFVDYDAASAAAAAAEGNAAERKAAELKAAEIRDAERKAADASNTGDRTGARAEAPAPLVAPAEPVGEPISYDAPATGYAPTPVSASGTEVDATKRDTYVPAATIGAGAGATAAAANDAPTQAYGATNTTVQPPVYIQAPTPPRYRGNRGAGVLVALLATLVYAALYAVVAFAISALGSGSVSDATAKFSDFIVLPIFYVPAIFFFIAFAVLILLVNRGGWWAYVLFGFLVAVVVYFAYIGGALLSVQAWKFTPDEAVRFVNQQWLSPGAIAAAVVAREVPIWAGAWIARRGRSVTARNAAAKTEYDRLLAEGPQGIRSN